MLVHEEEPFNAEPPTGALAGRFLTPLDAFYSRNHGPVPRIDAAAWRLEVDGLVERRLRLSLEELRSRFPEREVVATLQCAGNRRAELIEVRDIPGEDPWRSGAVSTARWTGVSLADVLAGAGLRPGAAHVSFTAPDVAREADPPQPYGGSIPAAKAVAGEVLLAWAMNGHPLPAVHGAPLRVVVPGWIGARSVKWLERVTARADPSGNYFQAVAYRMSPPGADPSRSGPGTGIPLGPVALTCDILSPEDGSRVPPGPTEITGYAFAGGGHGVARVDVSSDAGRTWSQAELDAPAHPWAWRLWRAVVVLSEGEADVLARAWDTAGATHPETPAALWNPKGYGNTSWGRLHLTCRR
ncbi:sulfite oxidase [Microtetraspora niveoalba]|uniref:sulfite oxidase n=1 Tax=Microtetraspora niveoalba TaxID=46175 RepID=UPI000A02DF28|nr:sulfite oxidase [Microtetraspora niveoalba]